jgi:hypothetical protein
MTGVRDAVMHWRRVAAMASLALVAGVSEARAIAIADYFVLGPRNAWEYRGAHGETTRITVLRTEGSRFVLGVPLGDKRAELLLGTTNGRVCLYRIGRALVEQGLPGGVDLEGAISW